MAQPLTPSSPPPVGLAVRFWGTRGSYPTSGRQTLGFGGHTSCVEISANGSRLIFDAGTGIIALGKTLLRGPKNNLRLNLFLTHTHHDHVLGFCFFDPVFRSETHLNIFGPAARQSSLQQALEAAMDSRLFPVGLHELKARIRVSSLTGGERLLFPTGASPRFDATEVIDYSSEVLAVRAHKSPAHPRNGVLLYRISYRGRSVVYATDIEHRRGGNPDVIDFIRGTDLLIHDAQYLNSEYYSRRHSRRGWGHSTIEMAVAVAKKAKVKTLVLFHHEPTREDAAVAALQTHARSLFASSIAAYEGMTIVV